MSIDSSRSVLPVRSARESDGSVLLILAYNAANDTANHCTPAQQACADCWSPRPRLP